MRTLPLKAITLQVTETGFVLETAGVEIGRKVGLVAEQTTGFSIAHFPYQVHPFPLPTRFLKDLSASGPGLAVAD
jgi:hypothetical protein